ncbi:hypothetical protein EJ05DRAFT_522338 [Pseudovirgaria hyperparasitica]|uniref:Uncharacterized protein n=1 Tax=Pseudovirgaria hyperparasitica TaxID=470096 RepID=A0A6A6WK14_9PEZI|nr:uncharacterized protein EJ05DRAFT_522338 [Pseudovirgaria hyperparasitica]KAF2762071.1 hypothetical protein EJ05DRAFT_522338 [Pseudovirgaria hyperparasitica]
MVSRRQSAASKRSKRTRTPLTPPIPTLASTRARRTTRQPIRYGIDDYVTITRVPRPQASRLNPNAVTTQPSQTIAPTTAQSARPSQIAHITALPTVQNSQPSMPGLNKIATIASAASVEGAKVTKEKTKSTEPDKTADSDMPTLNESGKTASAPPESPHKASTEMSASQNRASSLGPNGDNAVASTAQGSSNMQYSDDSVAAHASGIMIAPQSDDVDDAALNQPVVPNMHQAPDSSMVIDPDAANAPATTGNSAAIDSHAAINIAINALAIVNNSSAPSTTDYGAEHTEQHSYDEEEDDTDVEEDTQDTYAVAAYVRMADAAADGSLSEADDDWLSYSESELSDKENIPPPGAF